MTVAIIIQARMTSTRLPGKVLKKILEKELLYLQIERLKKITIPHVIIIATTTNDTDSPIVSFCEQHGLTFFRGSENDVLSRYYLAAQKVQANVIVRVTSDCPLIDPFVIEKVLNSFLSSGCDYASNTLERTYPRGLDCEVFSFKTLELAHKSALLDFQREHVTPYIYQNPNQFNLVSVINSSNLSHLRWTVDTVEDFDLINNIFTCLYPHNPFFSTNDILDCLNQNPKWQYINSHIEQKAL